MKQRWITADINSLNHFDAINQIYQGEIDGIHIKQVFTTEEMGQVKKKLLQKKESLSHLLHSQQYGELLGAILTAKGKDTSEYFEDVALVRKELKEIFVSDYEATIESVFLKLSGKRKVALAHQNGQAYSPAQIRFTYPDRGGIKLHKGNEFIQLEGFEGLHELIKLKDCLSYYLVIDKPEVGGELILYDDLPETLTVPKNDLNLDSYQQRRYAPEIGDLIVFHGACIWYAVSEVKGHKIRYSIGGFTGLSHNDEYIYYWA